MIKSIDLDFKVVVLDCVFVAVGSDCRPYSLMATQSEVLRSSSSTQGKLTLQSQSYVMPLFFATCALGTDLLIHYGHSCGSQHLRIPTVEDHKDAMLVFVADGRSHLEAFMITNPKIKAFRYDPYFGKLFLEEYDHKGMRETRRRAIARAKVAKT